MSNIYSAKFMHEASTTLESKVIKRPVNETYLFSTLNALHEMNTMIDNKTKQLYLQINEAESKEEENKLFADYFYQFKTIFSEFANRIQQMKSRMIISVENKVETWEDLYKDDQYISNFDEEFSYSGYKFCHMEDSDYPRLNLQKLYQKEFDYIGRLMQDTGMSASPSARLKIIATVCNNFANCSGDKNWIKDIIKEMVDIDEKEINKSYSECIYNSLRDKYDITVNKSTLYTCKEALCDYEDIIDAACKLCDGLLYDLDRVAENISSFLFRNQDNKLKIKTDTDGIIDRDYRLDTYSMNQLDLFLKNKINKIRKVLNIYSTAVGIKFDTAVDYIDQNIEILKAAKTYDANEPGGEEDENDNDDIDDVENGTSNDNDEPEVDDKPEDGNDDDFEFGSSDDNSDEGKESIEEEPEDDFGNFEFSDDKEEPMNNGVVDKNIDDFSEAYLFEAELFELEIMCNEYEMHQSIKEALLLEDPVAGEMMKNQQGSESPAQPSQTQTSSSNDNKSNDGNSGLKKLASKENDPNFFQKIIAKIKELWERFKKKFLDTTKDKIEYLKKNADYINKTKVNAEAGLKYTPEFGMIDKLTIPDFNYENMKDNLVDENKFCSEYFEEFYASGQDKSITDSIKTVILGAEQPKTNVNNLKTDVTAALNFCLGYEKKVNDINAQVNLLDKAERAARQNISRITESSSRNNYNQYFVEFDGDKVKDNQQKKDDVKIYFNVCSRVLAAKMTVCHNLFIEMYNYCNWWIMMAKGGNTEPIQKNTNQNQQLQK